MAKFSEMPGRSQLGIVVGVAVVLSLVLYGMVYKDMITANENQQRLLQAKLKENADLKQYEGRKVEMEQRIAGLQQQLETLNRIVPSEAEAPQFMEMMEDEASKAGIEIRRYTALPSSTREFFTEVPWDMELDGTYFALLNFFDRVSKLDRIINVSGLRMATAKKPGLANLKKVYAYAPSESVVVACTATTFFSRENQPPAGPVKK